LSLVQASTQAQSGVVSWFLRVVEEPVGTWTCRFGRDEFDKHPELEVALEHIRELAVSHAPAEVFVHHADGTVRRAS
jgi:hypothetical protein